MISYTGDILKEQSTLQEIGSKESLAHTADTFRHYQSLKGIHQSCSEHKKQYNSIIHYTKSTCVNTHCMYTLPIMITT